MTDPVRLDQSVALDMYNTLHIHREDGHIGRTQFQPGEIDEALAWLDDVIKGREPSTVLTSGALGAIGAVARHHDQQNIGRTVTGASASEQSAGAFAANVRRFADSPNRPLRVHSMEEFNRWVGNWGGRPVVFETTPQVEARAQLRRLAGIEGDLRSALELSGRQGARLGFLSMGVGLLVAANADSLTTSPDSPFPELAEYFEQDGTPFIRQVEDFVGFIGEMNVDVEGNFENANIDERGLFERAAFALVGQLHAELDRQARINAFMASFNELGGEAFEQLSAQDLANLAKLLESQLNAMTTNEIKAGAPDQLSEVLQVVREVHTAQLQLAMRVSYEPGEGVRYVFQDTIGGTNTAVELTFDQHGLASMRSVGPNGSIPAQAISVSLNNGEIINLEPNTTITRGLNGQFLATTRGPGRAEMVSLDLPAVRDLDLKEPVTIELAPHFDSVSGSPEEVLRVLASMQAIQNGIAPSTEFSVMLPEVSASSGARVSASSTGTASVNEVRVSELQRRYARRIWNAFERYQAAEAASKGFNSGSRLHYQRAGEGREEYAEAVNDYLGLLGYSAENRPDNRALGGILMQSQQVAGSTQGIDFNEAVRQYGNASASVRLPSKRGRVELRESKGNEKAKPRALPRGRR